MWWMNFYMQPAVLLKITTIYFYLNLAGFLAYKFISILFSKQESKTKERGNVYDRKFQCISRATQIFLEKLVCNMYIKTNKRHKILVIRLYFLLDALHISDYISPTSGATFISCTSLLCGYNHKQRCTAYESCF